MALVLQKHKFPHVCVHCYMCTYFHHHFRLDQTAWNHKHAKFGPGFVAVVAVTFHLATATEMAERRNVQDSNDDVFIADSCIQLRIYVHEYYCTLFPCHIEFYMDMDMDLAGYKPG